MTYYPNYRDAFADAWCDAQDAQAEYELMEAEAHILAGEDIEGFLTGYREWLKENGL